jgi:hypothetical protein
MTTWERLMLNVKVVKFLLANQAALLALVEIAKKWKKDLPYASQWELVNQVAKILIPVLEAQAVSPKSMLKHRFHDDDYEETDYEAMAFTAGAEFAALGVDWKLLIDVIIPIVLSILKALAAGKDE